MSLRAVRTQRVSRSGLGLAGDDKNDKGHQGNQDEQFDKHHFVPPGINRDFVNYTAVNVPVRNRLQG